MIEEYLTKEDFKRSGGGLSATVFISFFILMIILV